MELKEIRIIIDLMKKNDLALFQLEREGFKIKLQRGSTFSTAPGGASGGPMQITGAPTAAGVFSAAQLQTGGAESGALPTPGGAAAQPDAAAGGATAAGQHEINSPMVGTFYQAASPDSPPFIKVGQEVDEDTVVCIIEAMKVMNEIKAETRGVITEIVAENGKPVQFGQVLFRVK